MNRRRFIAAAAGGLAVAATAPSAVATAGGGAPVEPRRPPRIGVFGESNPLSWFYRSDAFELHCLWADEAGRRLGDLAYELVSLKPDVIVAVGERAARAAATVTSTTPIVFAVQGDLVRARLGDNVTGVSLPSERDLASRRLEALRESLPRLARVGVLRNPDNALHADALAEIRRGAERRGLDVCAVAVHMADELDRAFTAVMTAGAEALIVLPDALFSIHARPVVELAASHRLPALYPAGSFVAAGGLMALHGDSAAAIDGVVLLVRQILAGAKPSTLAVQRLHGIEVSVNHATAAELNLA